MGALNNFFMLTALLVLVGCYVIVRLAWFLLLLLFRRRPRR